MFARTVKLFGIGVALIFGSTCKEPEDCGCPDDDHFAGLARGANVVPLPTDTTPRGLVKLATNLDANRIEWTVSLEVAPPGTIDSIALYATPGMTTLPASATAILCAGAAACTATNGTAAIIAPANAATIKTSMRSYGTQVVFFTTTAQKSAGGAMRGTMFLNP